MEAEEAAEEKKTAKERNSWIESSHRMLSMLMSMSMSMSMTIGDVTGAGTVSVGDADGASTVTAYVVVLLVGFVRVVVVDFFEFSIFVVVGLVDPS